MNELKAENKTVNVNGLSSGVYVFKAEMENGTVQTFKVIKK